MLLTEISNPASGLSAEEAWFALAMIYRKKWVDHIPNNSENGGRMNLYRKWKEMPLDPPSISVDLFYPTKNWVPTAGSETRKLQVSQNSVNKSCLLVNFARMEWEMKAIYSSIVLHSQKQ